MENRDGVLWDGIFYYKDLTNAVKLSHQQMNHNFEMVASLSQNMANQVDMSAQSAAEALASQRAAALSETAANNAKTAAESAKNTAVSANTSAQSAKTAAETAKNTAVSANTSAQSAKTAAESARDAAVTARNTAQSSATTATNAKTAAETARTTATQKATEASASAAAAAQSASEAKESASAVTSVQGKQGIVNLARADFSWMGSASERDVGIGAGQVLSIDALPQATPAELNAGTQTAPRLFSPKQLKGASLLKKYNNLIEVTTSGSIPRPTTGEMIVVIIGGGGGGGGGSNKGDINAEGGGGQSGHVAIIKIESYPNATIPITIGAAGNPGAPGEIYTYMRWGGNGGDTVFAGIRVLGGAGGAGTVLSRISGVNYHNGAGGFRDVVDISLIENSMLIAYCVGARGTGRETLIGNEPTYNNKSLGGTTPKFNLIGSKTPLPNTNYGNGGDGSGSRQSSAGAVLIYY